MSESASATPAKILIVDDAVTNIQVLAKAIGSGHTFIFATNGIDALDQAASEAPDLILLDVDMPGMDGFDVCRRLKDDPQTQSIPVIFVTGKDKEEDEARGLEIGGIDYVTKPVRPPIVRARVKNHLELKRSRDLLEQLANLDGLTGIANRRKFDERVQAEWRRAQRNRTGIALIMSDIDFFKQFNDTYGHAAGDDCLRRIAAALARAVHRPGDLVARYGGEEFVCVLPETDLPGALEVAGRARDEVAALAILHSGSTVASTVTLSMGVAVLTPSADARSDDLLRVADERLYAAKAAGRDRVVSG